MAGKKCFIVGAGEFDRERFGPEQEDYIIAADGGYAFLQEMRIKPHLVVGDFDSLGFEPADENVICHPVMKDDTDLALACKTALQYGYTDLHIFGATGGRLDHTIAAMQLLVQLTKEGATPFLYGCGYTLTALVANGEGCVSLEFADEYQGGISVFSNTTRSDGVCEEGLLYTLQDATLFSDNALGVSNSFIKKEARISLREGALIILWYGNAGAPLPKHHRIEV